MQDGGVDGWMQESGCGCVHRYANLLRLLLLRRRRDGRKRGADLAQRFAGDARFKQSRVTCKLWFIAAQSADLNAQHLARFRGLRWDGRSLVLMFRADESLGVSSLVLATKRIAGRNELD